MVKIFIGVFFILGLSPAESVFRNGVLIGPINVVPVQARQFNVIDSFPAAAVEYSHGIACDGQYLWNNEGWSRWFARMDTAGSIINTFTPVQGDRDMTFDGEYLWAADWETASINQYDTSDCSIIATYYPPFAAGKPNGMAWDGSYLWVGEESGRIYKMTTTGDTVHSIPPPVYFSYDPRGLAFDGEHLWVGYQSSGLIYEVDTANGAVIATYSAPGVVPSWRFQQGLDDDGQYLWSTVGGLVNMIYQIDIGLTGVIAKNQSPPLNARLAIFPNPIRQTGKINFHLNKSMDVRLSIYDASGRFVLELVNKALTQGTHNYYLTRNEIQEGIFYAVLESGGQTYTSKIVKLSE